LVPIKDWISTVPLLIARWNEIDDELHFVFDYERIEWKKKEAKQLHSTIHSICLACTSPSHLQSLLDEGIIDHWNRLLISETGYAAIRVAMSHLISIDQQCREIFLDSFLLGQWIFPLVEIWQDIN
jgi:hypothetical protein